MSSPPGRSVCAPGAVTFSQLADRLTNTEIHHVDVKEIKNHFEAAGHEARPPSAM